MGGGSGPARTEPTVDVDEGEETVTVYARIPDALANLEGEARLRDEVGAYLRERWRGRYKVKDLPPTKSAEEAILQVRKGVGAGFDLRLWVTAPVVTLRATVTSRLEVLWALGAVLVGLVTFCVLSGALMGGMAPHFAVMRHIGKLAIPVGVAVTAVVGFVTWFPLRWSTRRARKESLEVAQEVLRDAAVTLPARVSRDTEHAG